MKLDMGIVSFSVPVIAALVLAIVGHPSERLPAAEPAPRAAAGFVLKSVSVELPASDRSFPGGAPNALGAEAINANCLSCHSAGMVLTQPALSKAAWSGIVEKMIHAYKAPVDAKAEALIVDYLEQTKGPSSR